MKRVIKVRAKQLQSSKQTFCHSQVLDKQKCSFLQWQVATSYSTSSACSCEHSEQYCKFWTWSQHDKLYDWLATSTAWIEICRLNSLTYIIYLQQLSCSLSKLSVIQVMHSCWTLNEFYLFLKIYTVQWYMANNNLHLHDILPQAKWLNLS